MTIHPPCWEIVWKRSGTTLRRKRFTDYEAAKAHYLDMLAHERTRWVAWNRIEVVRRWPRWQEHVSHDVPHVNPQRAY